MPDPGAQTSRRRRVSLRLLMLAVVLVSLPIARVTNHARAQRKAVAAIRRLGGSVEYDYQRATFVNLVTSGHPDRTSWLQKQLGREYFLGISSVSFSQPVDEADLWVLDTFTETRCLDLSQARITDATLARVAGMPHMKRLWLDFTPITDAGLPHLAGLREMEQLSLEGTLITDAGLARLGPHERLVCLNLGGTAIRGPGLAALKTSRSLDTLELDHTPLTDAALAHLAGHGRLRFLNLHGTAVTNACLVHLAALPGLRLVRLGETRVTPEGIDRLRAACPLVAVQD